MSSLKLNKLRKAVADSIYDDIFSRRNTYYYFFGKTTAFTGDQATPLTTQDYETFIRNNIIAAKKIYGSDVAFVVPRFDWVQGATYVQYSSQFTGIVDPTTGPKFYVYETLNSRVYKCVKAGTGSSEYRPTSTSPEVVTYADGYSWQYLYSIPTALSNKFLTADYIPVFTALQKRYYSDGGVGELTIVKAGSGYVQASTFITVTGDGSGAVLEPVITGGKLTDIIVKNPGRNYTRAQILITGIGSGAEVTVELSTGDLSSDQALVELLTTPGTVDSIVLTSGGAGYVTATVKIEGDGTGATAQATINQGAITSIVVSNKGSGYTYANVVITGQSTPQPPTSTASARANVSPYLGHGRDAVSELFASSLMFYGNIFSDRLADFDVSNDYRQYGIAKNFRNLEYSANVYDQVSPNRYTVSADYGPIVTFVGGGGIGAKGRVNVTGKVVSDLKLKNGGSGYTSAPAISFSGGGSPTTAATAVATIRGKLSTLSKTYSGVGYVSQPAVVVSSTTGKNGAAAATVGVGVGACVITNAGVGYTSAPTVTITGDGVGATAVASFADGKVAKITVTNPGIGYTTASVTLTNGGSPTTNATATAVLSYTVDTLSITKVGDYYQTNPEVSLFGSCGVSDVTINDSGSFSSTPAISFSGGGGNGATGVAMINDSVRKVTVYNQGAGYINGATVSFSGGSGTGAAATAVVVGGKVVDVIITNRGYGYTSAPSVSINYSGGTPPATAAAATAVVSKGITHINITNPGTGYTSAPTVVVSGGSGSGYSLSSVLGIATASATISGPIDSVTLVNSGAGYTSTPTVSLSGGGGGVDAVIAAKVVGSVSSITIDEGGSGYTSAPTVIISGGEGFGATAVASVSGGLVTSAVVPTNGGGNNYVLTKFSSFAVGDVLVDSIGNEYEIYAAMTNKGRGSFILTSRNGTPVIGSMELTKNTTTDYFITTFALSQKLNEARFPTACYKVRGSFDQANYPADTEVIISDQVNGNKNFVVVSSKVIDSSVTELLLAPTDGGTVTNGATIQRKTGTAYPFSVISYDKPAIDVRTGEILMINNTTAFTHNADQTLSFRTVINF